MKATRILAFTAGLALVSANPSAWATNIIASTSSSTIGNTNFVFTEIAGFRFSLNASFELNALGIWDDNQDGLELAHDIAIFQYQGAQVAFGSIAAGGAAPLIANTRWIEIAPVTLLPNIDYSIVATSMCKVPGSPGDRCLFGDTVSYNPLVNQSHLVFTADSNILAPGPYGSEVDNMGYLGPNFASLDIFGAPEPATLALLCLGCVTAGFVRRRRTYR